MNSRVTMVNPIHSPYGTYKRSFMVIVLVTLLINLVACLPQSIPTGENNLPAEETPEVSPTLHLTPIPVPNTTPTDGIPADRSDRLESIPPKDLERIPPSPVPIKGEVPGEILATILDDLAARADVDPVEVQILRAEAVRWSDGSLGCPQPDMMYTQAEVDGYWLVLQVDSQEYDYRITTTGYFLLCEQRLPPSHPTSDHVDEGSPTE
jgi:hypothetical protein